MRANRTHLWAGLGRAQPSWAVLAAGARARWWSPRRGLQGATSLQDSVAIRAPNTQDPTWRNADLHPDPKSQAHTQPRKQPLPWFLGLRVCPGCSLGLPGQGKSGGLHRNSLNIIE